MKGLKGVIVIATVVASAAILGACQKDIDAEPLKFDSQQTAR